ncbi:MAG: hypothetical protein JW747_02225 [Candidatus Aminicenantes bacterium]|nr:hypothetical protein [Candidatus Aminicenantes bacterium]
MKMFRSKRRDMVLKAAAALMLAVLGMAFLAPSAEAGACETALLSCLGDAAGLTGEGGPFWGLAYAAFCFEGYAFCREFLLD